MSFKHSLFYLLLIATGMTLCDRARDRYPYRSDSTGNHQHRHIKHKHRKRHHQRAYRDNEFNLYGYRLNDGKPQPPIRTGVSNEPVSTTPVTTAPQVSVNPVGTDLNK